MTRAEEALAHRWQEFRIRCLELAIKSGAEKDDAIPMADKIGEYILTKSEREKNAVGAEQCDKGCCAVTWCPDHPQIMIENGKVVGTSA